MKENKYVITFNKGDLVQDIRDNGIGIVIGDKLFYEELIEDYVVDVYWFDIKDSMSIYISLLEKM